MKRVFDMQALMMTFLILALGYAIGCIGIKGIRLGDSAVLLVALVFGHFGVLVPGELKDFGLMLFVCAVGFIAGPVFFDNFRKRAFSYIALGVVIVAIGALSAGLSVVALDIPAPLAIGLLSGALTSTPALAVACEVSDAAAATVGYGIAYPFGVIGVVLFCQLTPRLLRADIQLEASKLSGEEDSASSGAAYKKIEPSGFMAFTAAMVVGLLIAKVKIPLPGGMSFSLGTSGGPLVSGLLFGRFYRFSGYSFEVPKPTLNTLRELGLVLFLAGAGSSAGQGFVEVLRQYGVMLFIAGALITLIPMLIGYLMAVKLFRLEMFNALGSICGGMTSTPALGTLITVSGTTNVAAAYAATYPIALIVIVFAVQILAMVF